MRTNHPRWVAALAALAVLGACAPQSPAYVPGTMHGVANRFGLHVAMYGHPSADSVTFTLKIHNATNYAIHQQKVHGWCISRTPTTQIPGFGTQEQTITVDTSTQRCRDQAMFFVMLTDPDVKRVVTYDFSIFGAASGAPGIRIDDRGYGGFCSEASPRMPFILKITTTNSNVCEKPLVDALPAVSRAFSVTVENASEKALVGLALNSFCMSSTLGGKIAAGATETKTVSTFGRSDVCNYAADFTTYYWDPSSPGKYVAAIEWIFEGPSTVKIYARGFDGYCTAKPTETQVKIFKATDGRC